MRLIRAAAAATFLCLGGVVVLYGTSGSAFGHHAPSGWKYPGECCGKNDCFPLPNPPDDVKWTPGGWLITETNETIPFDKAQVSGDAHWHRCILTEWSTPNGYGQRTPTRKTRTTARGVKCLYVPTPEN